MNKNIKIILASASPRRHELLLAAGLPHEILVTDAEENPAGAPSEGVSYAEWFAAEASKLKGKAALEKITPEEGVRVFVVSADTIVSPDKKAVFGKPASREDAVATMSLLSGRVHYVVGGITVAEAGKDKSVSRAVVTEVRFKSLTDGEISAYVDTAEPYDKAGSYGIQGIASMFVESVTGDYPNVVGISVASLCDILTKDFGVSPADLIGE
jgi:septum formation protein